MRMLTIVISIFLYTTTIIAMDTDSRRNSSDGERDAGAALALIQAHTASKSAEASPAADQHTAADEVMSANTALAEIVKLAGRVPRRTSPQPSPRATQEQSESPIPPEVVTKFEEMKQLAQQLMMYQVIASAEQTPAAIHQVRAGFAAIMAAIVTLMTMTANMPNLPNRKFMLESAIASIGMQGIGAVVGGTGALILLAVIYRKISNCIHAECRVKQKDLEQKNQTEREELLRRFDQSQRDVQTLLESKAREIAGITKHQVDQALAKEREEQAKVLDKRLAEERTSILQALDARLKELQTRLTTLQSQQAQQVGTDEELQRNLDAVHGRLIAIQEHIANFQQTNKSLQDLMPRIMAQFASIEEELARIGNRPPTQLSPAAAAAVTGVARRTRSTGRTRQGCF